MRVTVVSPSVEVKEELPDVVFRGTIMSLRDSKATTDFPLVGPRHQEGSRFSR